MDAHLIRKEPRIGFEMSLAEAKELFVFFHTIRPKNERSKLFQNYASAREFVDLLDSIIERAERNDS